MIIFYLFYALITLWIIIKTFTEHMTWMKQWNYWWTPTSNSNGKDRNVEGWLQSMLMTRWCVELPILWKQWLKVYAWFPSWFRRQTWHLFCRSKNSLAEQGQSQNSVYLDWSRNQNRGVRWNQVWPGVSGRYGMYTWSP